MAAALHENLANVRQLWQALPDALALAAPDANAFDAAAPPPGSSVQAIAERLQGAAAQGNAAVASTDLGIAAAGLASWLAFLDRALAISQTGDGSANERTEALCDLFRRHFGDAFPLDCRAHWILVPGNANTPVENAWADAAPTANAILQGGVQAPPRVADVTLERLGAAALGRQARVATAAQLRERGALELGAALAAQVDRIASPHTVDEMQAAYAAVPGGGPDELLAKLDYLATEAGLRVVRFFSPEFEAWRASFSDPALLTGAQFEELCRPRGAPRRQPQRVVLPQVANDLVAPVAPEQLEGEPARRRHPANAELLEWGFVLVPANGGGGGGEPYPYGYVRLLQDDSAEPLFVVASRNDPGLVANVGVPAMTASLFGQEKVRNGMHVDVLCARRAIGAQAANLAVGRFLLTYALADGLRYRFWSTHLQVVLREAQGRGISAGRVTSAVAALFHTRFKYQRAFAYERLDHSDDAALVFRDAPPDDRARLYVASRPGQLDSFMFRPYPTRQEVEQHIGRLALELGNAPA